MGDLNNVRRKEANRALRELVGALKKKKIHDQLSQEIQVYDYCPEVSLGFGLHGLFILEHNSIHFY